MLTKDDAIVLDRLANAKPSNLPSSNAAHAPAGQASMSSLTVISPDTTSPASAAMVFESAAVREPEKRRHLKALTGLRIFAALMIVFYHSADSFGIDHHRFIASLALVQGVSLFFVLSGFILTYTYPNLQSTRDTTKFILLRLARIWPVHLATATFAALFLADKWHSHPYVLLPNFLLLQGWIPVERFFFSLNAVSWSVSAELFFYCCFPFVSRAVQARPFLSVLASFLVAASCVGVSRLFPPPLGHLDQVSSFGVAYIDPLVRIFEFIVGVATARLYFRHRDSLSALGGKKLMITETVVLLAVLLLVGCLRKFCSSSVLDSIAPNLSLWVECSGGVFIYASLVFFLALEKGWLYKLLSKPLFVWLGEISYSVYLVHWLWIKVFVRLNFVQMHLPRMANFSLYLFLVLSSAALLYSLVEKPARAFLGRKVHVL
jgi:peptidoglycan/LPS O-acetylase OafA/YrhL